MAGAVTRPSARPGYHGLGFDSVHFSPFLTKATRLAPETALRGHFSRQDETARRRSRATRVTGGRERVFPYRFHSLVLGADFGQEPAAATATTWSAMRRGLAAVMHGPGTGIDRKTFLDDYLVERLSDVAARQPEFLARLGS